jgi:hypothetical protein
MTETVASYLDFIAFAYPTVLLPDENAAPALQPDATLSVGVDSLGGGDPDAVLSVGVEKALKLGFSNSYLSKTLILTEDQLNTLIDFVDSGALQADYPDVDQVKAKEVLLWLKDVLKSRSNLQP